jgi:cellulose biosynthesis protein BcsQ
MMIGAQTVYSESGGSYKTTTAANLAVAWTRMGLDVLVVDLDPQSANLSRLFNVDEDQEKDDADNLVRHMLGRPDGPFEDLIKTSEEGVDVIPAHDEMSNFTRYLVQQQEKRDEILDADGTPPETGSDIAWIGDDGDWRDIPGEEEYLFELFWNVHNLNQKYDMILIDPNARAEAMLFNALFATRTLITPMEPTGKGSLSIDGIKDIINGMEDALNIDIGISAVLPMAAKGTNIHESYLGDMEAKRAVPITVGERSALMDLMWDANYSIFRLTEGRYKFTDGEPVEHGRHSPRDHNIKTVLKIWDLAHHIVSNVYETDVPNPVLELDVDEKDTYVFQPTEEFPREEEYPDKKQLQVLEAQS